MQSFYKKLIFIILFPLYCTIALAQAYLPTFIVQIPDSLKFININGKPTAYYELYLTNFSADTFKLKNLSILKLGDCIIQFNSQNQDLQNRYTRIGITKRDTTMLLTPGSTSVIYIELSLLNKTITEITHRIGYEVVGKEYWEN